MREKIAAHTNNNQIKREEKEVENKKIESGRINRRRNEAFFLSLSFCSKQQ